MNNDFISVRLSQKGVVWVQKTYEYVLTTLMKVFYPFPLFILITITNYQLLLQNTKGNTLENVGNQTVLVTTDFYYIDKKHRNDSKYCTLFYSAE